MAKGPIITPDVAGLIANMHRKNEDWKAPKVRYEVEKAWRKKHPGSPVGFPSLSTVQRMLAIIRKNEQLDFLEDRSWTLDALRDKDKAILPEALPKVFEIWLIKQANPLSPPLSIREARWISQLSSITEDVELLRLVAEMCAERELIGDLTNTPQLSMPSMILEIYAELTKMSLETKQKHYHAILKEKHVSDSRRKHVIEGLQNIYGSEFVERMGLKSKSKKRKGGTK